MNTPCALLLLVAALSGRVRADRVLGITNVENCREFESEAVVQLQKVTYHVDPETGVSDTVHGEFNVRAGDTQPRILTMTLFKCADPTSTEVCLSNPTVREEVLGCDRLIGDETGPWAMFSQAIAGSNCGKEVGVFSMDYSTLRLNNIINYLDIHDTDFGRYRMRMYFHSTQTDSIRACVDLDFRLVN